MYNIHNIYIVYWPKRQTDGLQDFPVIGLLNQNNTVGLGLRYWTCYDARLYAYAYNRSKFGNPDINDN